MEKRPNVGIELLVLVEILPETDMDEETVNVIIHPDGRVELQVCGVKGEKCLEVTRAVEEALGNKVKRELTSEMYETETETELAEEKRKLGY